jgi:hypothetical protein
MQLGKVRAAQQLVKGKEGIVSQRDPKTVLNRANGKGATGATDGPQSLPAFAKRYLPV